jgi:hypothetical protein
MKLILFTIIAIAALIIYSKSKKKKKSTPIVEIPQKIEVVELETPVETTSSQEASEPIKPTTPVKKRKYNKNKSAKKMDAKKTTEK